MKILVVGCAISGTVLMTRMFSAFKLFLPNKDIFTEQGNQLKKFIKMQVPAVAVNVKKANKHFVFGGESAWPSQQLSEINGTKDLKIVHIRRNGMDIMQSKPIPKMCKMWVIAAREFLQYPAHIDCSVKFEDLVTKPDEVQVEIADTLGLKIIHKFSEYPNFLPLTGTWRTKKKIAHILRPLDPGRIGKAIDFDLDEACGDLKDEFIELNRKLGYEN